MADEIFSTEKFGRNIVVQAVRVSANDQAFQPFFEWRVIDTDRIIWRSRNEGEARERACALAKQDVKEHDLIEEAKAFRQRQKNDE